MCPPATYRAWVSYLLFLSFFALSHVDDEKNLQSVLLLNSVKTPNYHTKISDTSCQHTLSVLNRMMEPTANKTSVGTFAQQRRLEPLTLCHEIKVRYHLTIFASFFTLGWNKLYPFNDFIVAKSPSRTVVPLLGGDDWLWSCLISVMLTPVVPPVHGPSWVVGR